MHVRLWHSPYNGGWIYFARRNLRRFDAGWTGTTLWWALFGFSGSIILQSWPWQKSPCVRALIGQPAPEGGK